MPNLLIWNGYRFYFYSHESGEPPHIHVDKERFTAKFWLKRVELASFKGFKDNELSAIARKVAAERKYFLEEWYDYFKRHR